MKPTAILAWSGLLLAGGLTLPSVAADASLRREALRVGLTQNAFAGVNHSDAEAAFKVFCRTAGVKRGYDIEASVQLYDSAAGMAAAVENAQINLIIPDTWLYLEMTNTHRLMKPRFVTSERGRVTKEFLIVTRRDSGLDTLASLRGKSLNRIAAANTHLGIYWLESILRGQNLGDGEEFFSPTETLGKVSAVVLPVFFGKRQACLVDSAGLATMSELNPQVGKELQVIATSPPLVNALVCLHENGWSSEQYKQDLTRALAELHEEPAGQQILTLFKTERLAPYEESQIATVRQLHTQMLNRRPDNPAARGPLANAQTPTPQP